jgi:predicted PurR-regulated permease PerM
LYHLEVTVNSDQVVATFLNCSEKEIVVLYSPRFAVLAATLAVVPFLGTYWACLPACLDLWLGQQKGMQAVMLFVFQFLPSSLVDTTIYQEIKG